MANPRHTILVVDDEPDVVRSVHDLLRLDYRVLGATSGAEGMKILESEEVHVIMTDQRMPEMSGVEFLKQARGDYPEATRLLFTGYADLKAVIEAINQGNVYRYITKPWDPDELQAIIREAIERYDLIVQRNQLLNDMRLKNQEMERANAQLRENSELKTAFIQVASHELRTPLTILLGLTKLVRRRPDVAPSLQEWLGRIDAASHRLRDLVEQLVAMLVAGNFDTPLRVSEVDVLSLLQEAIDDVRPFAELRRQELSTDIAPDLGMLRIDRDKIRDCLNHLLLNAVKFTPDEGNITLAAKCQDGQLEVKISDTGVGMDAVHQSRLFEPFFTGFDVSHHSSGVFEYRRQGLGLGLSVVKAFVEKHGGKVEVESHEGKGTTFTLTVPGQP